VAVPPAASMLLMLLQLLLPTTGYACSAYQKSHRRWGQRPLNQAGRYRAS